MPLLPPGEYRVGTAPNVRRSRGDNGPHELDQPPFGFRTSALTKSITERSCVRQNRNRRCEPAILNVQRKKGESHTGHGYLIMLTLGACGKLFRVSFLLSFPLGKIYSGTVTPEFAGVRVTGNRLS